ncbi:MAG: hypothetical protein IT433_03825 [Phycisphaerales bacterium]|nr:hypothetical protein [Phycisphaerales bacterium]
MRQLGSVYIGSACVLLALAGCERAPSAGGPLEVEVRFGEVGANPGQFSYPRCLDSDGEALWVIDKMARVQKLSPEGDCLGGWRMPEWENGKPTGITVWTPPAGGPTRVIIPDTHYHRVMIYDPAGMSPPGGLNEGRGTLLGTFGSYGEGEGQFIYLTDVAVMPTHDGKGIARLYVSEYGGHDRISAFRPRPGQAPGMEAEFEFEFAFGRFGSGEAADPVEFNRPQSIEIEPETGELIVTDACNHRIGVFTPGGQLVRWIGGRARAGREVGQMSYPYGLVLLGDRTAMVAEFGSNRVQRFDLVTGESLGVFGEAGRRAGQLASPWGLCLEGSRVFVLDSGNNRLQAFERPAGKRHVGAPGDRGKGPG